MAGRNWKDYLVKIIVPGGKGKDYIATGYPFRKGCILTALHAIKIDKKDCDSSRPWQLRWEHWKDDKGDPVERKVNRPEVITSNKGLDWAVIRCDFDEQPHNAVCFCPDPFPGGIFVETEGFPASRHKDRDGLFHLGFQGNAQSKAESSDYFQIDPGAGYTNPKDSGGLSGAPIFNRAGQLVGLFAQIPEGLDGETVWVLSSTSLLQDGEFNQLLAPEQKSPRYSVIKQLLESRDFGNDEFRRFLVDAFRVDCDVSEYERLVDAVASQGMQQCLLSLYRRIREQIANEKEFNLSSVIAFCNRLLPEYAREEDEDELRKHLDRTSGANWYPHAAATYQGIESSMAKYDKRPANMKWVSPVDGKPGPNLRSLRGVNCIELPQSAGGEIDSKTGLSESEDSFYFQFSGPRTRERQYPRLRAKQQEPNEARKILRQAASRELRYRSEEENQTRYHVQSPDTENALLESLARDCPYFLLLRFNDDQDRIDEEEGNFRPLSSLYELKPEKDE